LYVNRLDRLNELAEHLWHTEADEWYPESDWVEVLAPHCAGDGVLLDEACRFVRSATANKGMLTVEIAISTGEGTIFETPTQINEYRIVKRIGIGGMGIVYEASKQSEDVTFAVALKLIKAGLDTEMFIRRFRNERFILSLLNHDNIIRILAAGSTASGRPYLVMSLVEGGLDIEKYCQQHSLPVLDRLKLFNRVCEAVRFMHDQGVVHRDLKSSNILVDRNGSPKLLDFGLAKLLKTEEGLPSFTFSTVGDVKVGTKGAMSREQEAGGEVSYATDVYGLGLILKNIVPDPLGTSDPTQFKKIVDQALQPDQTERFQNGGELFDAIDAFLRRSEKPAQKLQLQKRSKRGLFAVLAVLSIGLISSLFMTARRPLYPDASVPKELKTEEAGTKSVPSIVHVPQSTAGISKEPPRTAESNAGLHSSKEKLNLPTEAEIKQITANNLADVACREVVDKAITRIVQPFVNSNHLVHDYSPSETTEQMLRRYALAGNVDAQLALASLYIVHSKGILEIVNGKSHPGDYQRECGNTIFTLNKKLESLEWLKAAGKNRPQCALIVAMVYHYGWAGLLANPWDAFRWASIAAANGNATAHYELGLHYIEGKAVPLNEKAAIEQWKIGAEMDDLYSQLHLATLYAAGNKNLPKDIELAHFWSNLAASNPQMAFFPGAVDAPGAANPERTEAAALRDAMAKNLTTDQITDLTKRASLWKSKKRPALTEVERENQ
jgi:serine/threonine protein kinase